MKHLQNAKGTPTPDIEKLNRVQADRDLTAEIQQIIGALPDYTLSVMISGLDKTRGRYDH